MSAVSDEIVEKALDKFMDAGDWREAKDADILRDLMHAALESVLPDLVKAENEECAVIAEDHAPATQDMLGTNIADACDEIAAAIRARHTKEKEAET